MVTSNWVKVHHKEHKKVKANGFMTSALSDTCDISTIYIKPHLVDIPCMFNTAAAGPKEIYSS